MSFSPQQEQALKLVKEWLKDPSRQVFKLFGYAGTGKTTLAKTIAENVDGTTLYGAFTGKAASVLRRKGCKNASTIHGMIYTLVEARNKEPRFVLDADSDVKRAKIVIIDEASMVDEAIGRDLLSFGTKVLVLGDPAQLPPVKGQGFFTSGKPDFMLTEVHRQARDNPIIALSMKIREGYRIAHGDYGSCKVITHANIDQNKVMSADQVIVGLNRTRQSYNARIRQLLGYNSEFPIVPDKLVCLKNDRMKGIFNGTLWEVSGAVKNMSNPISMEVRAQDDESERIIKIEVRPEFFTGLEGSLSWDQKKDTQEFTYGYALTCHKSQGSQWNDIVVFDESRAFREEANRWLYTAVTRAAQTVTVVRA